jgi:hypothetical protein
MRVYNYAGDTIEQAAILRNGLFSVVSLIFRDEPVKPRLIGVSSRSIKYAYQGYKNGLEHTLLPQQVLPLLWHPV